MRCGFSGASAPLRPKPEAAQPLPPPVLSGADRQRLEALLRNPQIFAGTPQAIVDETLKRATQVLEQSKANEQALMTAAKQREAALRQVLDGVAPDHDAQRKEVQGLIAALIKQIEAALAQAGKS
ncbi:hypothetical protein PSH66_01065 [Pseudomonas sp. FP597]|uniref:hypothetical protein n=1 Tax=Pseudomonas sp. FP597 TaxID=2954096 RepID=UPI0027340297|nr:hypothetical protein [Pseudomonas sp. FP597]WLI06947.1 hypothetical protein PSH66_01065 [Pseudomonas sp. FP597]